jgi:hypothetical protein
MELGLSRRERRPELSFWKDEMERRRFLKMLMVSPLVLLVEETSKPTCPDYKPSESGREWCRYFVKDAEGTGFCLLPERFDCSEPTRTEWT